jgi:hypothetical protein
LEEDGMKKLGIFLFAACVSLFAQAPLFSADKVTLWVPGIGVVGPDEKGTEYGNTLETNVKYYLDTHPNIALNTTALHSTYRLSSFFLLPLPVGATESISYPA